MSKITNLSPKDQALVTFLRKPETIRERCHVIFQEVSKGKGLYFSFHEENMSALTDYVLDEINLNYPDFNIPYHSRFRHFEAGGINRVRELRKLLPSTISKKDWGQVLFEWVVVSVLTDAGAGAAWSFREESKVYQRSEGLAVASYQMFRSGAFSAHSDDPFRVDGSCLRAMTPEILAKGFHVSDENPLEGLDGRSKILKGLGEVLRSSDLNFTETSDRLGDLWSELWGFVSDGSIDASKILQVILERLSSIWPDGRLISGFNIGDVGCHPALNQLETAPGLVPFHKLSQWLSYSLLEVFEEASVTVTGINALTGLPEYRNGGLLIDLGVLEALDPSVFLEPLRPESEPVTEWRALTLAILDVLGESVRKKLGRTGDDMPLAKVLQGGTWSAGRRIAKEKRAGGLPPFRLVSTGTIF